MRFFKNGLESTSDVMNESLWLINNIMVMKTQQRLLSLPLLLLSISDGRAAYFGCSSLMRYFQNILPSFFLFPKLLPLFPHGMSIPMRLPCHISSYYYCWCTVLHYVHAVKPSPTSIKEHLYVIEEVTAC